MTSLATPSIVHRHRHSPWPAVPMAEAWQIVEEQFGKVLDRQLRQIEQKQANDPELLGTVLAEPIHAMKPVPAFRASIKDGYAVIASDGNGARRVVASSTAAKMSAERSEGERLETGQCVRITTGARVPLGADAVVQVEDTRVLEHDDKEELMVEIGGKTPQKGQDIREIGSDVADGELLLEKGTVLNAAEIGLLALSGLITVRIYKRPRVAVLSTGDELIDFFAEGGGHSSTAPAEGAVMDTNRPVLISLLRSQGFQPVDLGIIGDDLNALVETVRHGLTETDLLVVTGGVSMGEKDLLKEVLVHHIGLTIHFGRVFMKPGLPTTFASGTLSPSDGRAKFVFALPGNPVSAFVTAHLFVLPQLRRCAGIDEHWDNARLRVQLTHPIASLDARPEYRRAVLCRASADSDFPLAQCVFGSQISSRLPSARSANLLLELPSREKHRTELDKGALISALIIGPL